jgi:hypothetical protein
MKRRVQRLFLIIFSLSVIGASSAFAQPELAPLELELLKPELIEKLSAQEKQNYYRAKNDLLINQWLVQKSFKATQEFPTKAIVLELLGNGYFASYVRLAKAEYEYAISMIKERHANSLAEMEEARGKRLEAKAGVDMVRETLRRRYEIGIGEISESADIKEEDRKIIVGEKQMRSGSVAYLATQKVLAGVLGYTTEQLSAAIKKDLKVEIGTPKVVSYEVFGRTAGEVVSGSPMKPVKIITDGKTPEQIAEELFKSSFPTADVRRIFVKQVQEDGTAKSWSYDTSLGLKYPSDGEVIDLLAPAPAK